MTTTEATELARPAYEAAALHGLATNAALPVAERLALALQALDMYRIGEVDLAVDAFLLHRVVADAGV